MDDESHYSTDPSEKHSIVRSTREFVPPPRITAILSHLSLPSVLLFTPFSRMRGYLHSSITIKHLIIIAAYLAFVVVALVWNSSLIGTTKSSGYGYDFTRSGIVATTQIPIAVALGVRGNLIGLSVGQGHEKLKVFHKIVGRATFVCATLHAAFYGMSFSKRPKLH
jgi:ferric-chelate reductase